tara:strand:+ start:3949 stop:4248 length:300 start_codon:yes stop_codon:yes gene_type:complete
MNGEKNMISEQTITQLEKRARGFRRIISSLNDLPMYGINSNIDRILYVKIEDLKEHLKKKITRNNEKLNEIYTTSIDSLLDDNGSSTVVVDTEVPRNKP